MVVVHSESAFPEGLRARKQRQTRQRIAEAALRLFLERGFEATTLDAIAQAADISRRTFFHYFASKEAIVAALENEEEAVFRAALCEAPPDLSPIEAVRQALHTVVSRYETEEAIAIDRLMRSTEALRARKQANYERRESALFTALCEIWPSQERKPALRMVAMVAIGALRLAVETWRAEEGRETLQVYLDEAFENLRRELKPG